MNNLIDLIEEPVARRWMLKNRYWELEKLRDEYRQAFEHPSEEALKRFDQDIAACEAEIAKVEGVMDEEIAKFNTAELTREMKVYEFVFRLLFKFSADGSIREDVKNKTRQQFDAWEKWKRAEWEMRDDALVKGADGKLTRGKDFVPKSYQQLVAGIEKVLDAYEQMLYCYARMPTEAVANSEHLAALSEKANTAISLLDRIYRRDSALAREQAITQRQVAKDFAVTIGTVKNWDKGRKNSWGYDRSLRMDPLKRKEYQKCVYCKRCYDDCKIWARKEGRIWRYNEQSFVENLHSLSQMNVFHSERDVYEAMMRKMDE